MVLSQQITSHLYIYYLTWYIAGKDSNTNLRTNVFITVVDIITYTINNTTLNLIKMLKHLPMKQISSRWLSRLGFSAENFLSIQKIVI